MITKEKMINCLKTNIPLWNRYRKLSKYVRVDLRNADLCNIKNITIYRVGGIGSEKRDTYYVFENDYINCGCFKGSFQEWIKKIKYTYRKDDLYYQQYKRAATYLFWIGRLK